MASTRQNRLHVIITGGGTGGHLFPGISVAQTLMAQNPENRILFVGTGRPIERRLLAEHGYDHVVISAEALKGRSKWRQAAALSKMPKGILQSMWIFSRFKPDVVLGVGGYSAAPAMAAAWMCGIKRAIHEQNAIPGITNRMLAGPANRVFVSIGSPSAPWCRGKGVFTGNPVRKRILIEAASVDRQGPFTILVLGGSQGAHRINEAVIASLKHLAKGTVRFIHQTGESDRSAVKAAYESHGIEARISAFFTDMGRQYGEADLIVSRAGATTVAEIAAIGKCALFIPYPFAADNHQEANAKMLVEAGAGEMILERSLGGDTLAETIARYAADSDLRNQMAENARRLGKPDAAERIVEEIRKLITDNR